MPTGWMINSLLKQPQDPKRTAESRLPDLGLATGPNWPFTINDDAPDKSEVPKSLACKPKIPMVGCGCKAFRCPTLDNEFVHLPEVGTFNPPRRHDFKAPLTDVAGKVLGCVHVLRPYGARPKWEMSRR
ncbi:hypothetical protein ZHAS_00021423 [Anopheles sinensis]|uniref:Uncharacterized protein n=1 Tax=Anopheles sinensis TaxID=74873 RepID=A0A084WSD5_ANOSI|nr:hypothetical protein ZHAS_00021423 [Anopheles sinensis]